MKIIPTILLLCLSLFSVQAQSFVYRPTPWSQTWVSTMNNAAQARTYLGIVAGLTNYGQSVTNWQMYGTTLNGNTTNSAATASTIAVYDANKILGSGVPTVAVVTTNGAQTITGTKTFQAAQNLTNMANVISGNGAGLTNLSLINNQITRRFLWGTNALFFSSVATNAAADRTNSGDYATITQAFKATIPALKSSNSIVLIFYHAQPTNLNLTVATMWLYGGSNTNYLGFTTSAMQAGNFGPSILSGNVILKNYGDWTNQVQLSAADAARYNYVPNNKVDTSVPWNFYMGLSTTANCTNVNIYNISLEEVIFP
jgi:hypothetical protein